MKTRLIIVAAPSGAGKSTLVKMILEDLKELKDSVSYTTRSARKGEKEGNPYHFVSKAKFQKLIEEDFFIEWAQVHGNFYGTPQRQSDDAWKEGKWLIMDLDVKGAATFKKKSPDATSIFILPPSVNELRRRIVERDKGKTPDLELRMQNAIEEMLRAPQFDYSIINADIKICYSEFKKVIEDIIKKG